MRPRLLGLLLAMLGLCGALAAEGLRLSPLKPTGIYEFGEPVGWTVTPGNAALAGKWKFVIRKNNLKPIDSGEIDLNSGPATIQTTCDEPAMLYLELSGGSDDRHPTVA